MIKELVLAVSILLSPTLVKAQAPAAVGYNVTMCTRQGHGTLRLILSEDKKSLDVAYYLEKNQIQKDESTDGSHIVFSIDTYHETENHFIIIRGTTTVPDDNDKDHPIELQIQAESFGTRFVAVVYANAQPFTILYGTEGSLDDLTKIDQDAAGQTCIDILKDGEAELPKNLINWLKFGHLISNSAPITQGK